MYVATFHALLPFDVLVHVRWRTVDVTSVEKLHMDRQSDRRAPASFLAKDQRDVRRNLRGLTPNSVRNARLKFEMSVKPQSSATSITFPDSATSRVAASHRRARRTY